MAREGEAALGPHPDLQRELVVVIEEEVKLLHRVDIMRWDDHNLLLQGGELLCDS